MGSEKQLISILLDARKLGDGGIGVYIENLINGLLTLRRAGELSFSLALLLPEKAYNDLSYHETEEINSILRKWKREVVFYPERSGRYSIEEYLFLAHHQREHLKHINVYHSPHYTLPYFLGVPTVVTIHDIIHVTHPDTRWHKIVGKQLISSAMHRASHIITVSEASKERLAQEFGDLSVPVTVVPNGIRSNIQAQPADAVEEYCRNHFIGKPYFVFVGSDRPHKGFNSLIKAWGKINAELTGYGLPALIAVGDRFSPETKAEVCRLGLAASVHFVGHATNQELSILYSGSEAVVIPSLEEGFGLMAVEAMACNTRVVANPLPSIKEICGDTAYYADNFTVDSIANAVERCLHDRDGRDVRIVNGTSRAVEFSIENAARKTFAVYQSVVSHSSLCREEMISQELATEMHISHEVRSDVYGDKISGGE